MSPRRLTELERLRILIGESPVLSPSARDKAFELLNAIEESHAAHKLDARAGVIMALQSQVRDLRAANELLQRKLTAALLGAPNTEGARRADGETPQTEPLGGTPGPVVDRSTGEEIDVAGNGEWSRGAPR